MTHLLQIQLGPVQEFIAAARRSRDLWFGSWMLSELSKAAARAIAEREGVDALIFPAPDVTEDDVTEDLEPGSDLAVANKIVALVEGDPDAIVTGAKKAVNKRLDTLTQTAIPTSKFGTLLTTYDTALAQINDLVEFYWVAVPCSENNFAQARKSADGLLASRKNTRDFRAVAWGGHKPKSSLDGKRETVLPKGAEKLEDPMYKVFRGRLGEQLSGVDLLKRLGTKEKRASDNEGDDRPEAFPSTSHMAALSLKGHLEKLEDPTKVQDAWQKYVATLSSTPSDILYQERIYHELALPLLQTHETHKLDGSLLYESRLAEYLKKETGLNIAKSALQTFFKETNLPEPNSYYALLVGDGDFMGRAIARLVSAKANRQFSQTLSGFASEVEKILKKHDGALIYAGGDDVMALLPLHTAIQCTQDIAQQFRETMGKAELPTDVESPTFSAGLAIVHHLEPLDDALAYAREAEKEAKRFEDADGNQKNALAITLVKRSGVPRTVCGKWGELDRRLLEFVKLKQEDAIPARLAYQMRSTYLGLGGAEAKQHVPDIDAILKAEATRLINRKRQDGGRKALDEKVIDDLEAHFEASNMASMATELMISAEIARAMNLAGTTPELATTEEDLTS